MFGIVAITLPFCDYIFVCIAAFFVNVDIQILQIKVCQKLQEEAKPKKNKMDQSIQKGNRKGADSGEKKL